MYRQIDTAFWTDPKIKKLSPQDKLLFLYFVTNPHAHLSGIYYLPAVTIVHETGLSASQIRRGIDTLSIGHLVYEDGVSEVIWVRKMLHYQGRGSKIVASVASHLASLHNCSLIKHFLEEYEEWRIPYRYPIDGSSIQEQEKEQEQNQEKEKKTPLPPSGGMEVFELPEWIDGEAWKGFTDMRKKIRKPLTEKAKYLIVQRLEKLKEAGDDPNKVLNQSTANSWQGVFPLNDVTGGKNFADF